MKSHNTILIVFLLLSLLSFPASITSFAADVSTYHTSLSTAKILVESMTPEERVGQLFLVSFYGTTADDESQILTLIRDHHIGGVILTRENDNFIDGEITVEKAYDLIYQLQIGEWKAANVPITDIETGVTYKNQYIPLFVGISQPGGGAPEDQILYGLTQLPNQMAIGATWDLNLAEQVGTIYGDELSKLGFNLYLGPSLDVLETPESTLGNKLGAGVFGGDPFWVAKMGQAYIKGLHAGSQGKMLVIARNFPGKGSSDRPAGDEPATVRRSLEALKQIELAPFFAVTGNTPDSASQADGLLVSHIRYQGLQGNIRATTKPVSFDSQALTQILSLPEFSTWSSDGGLLISDDLGSDTVRRFYDPGGVSFQGRIVARDAFLAGNDLLFLGNIQSSDKPDTYETVLNILTFFTQKYNEDTAFAQRVDQTVERILAAKLKVFGKFQLSSVIPSRSKLVEVGRMDSVTFNVARQAATLVSPEVLDLETIIPSPPDETAKIVFISDTRSSTQCSGCEEVPILAVDEMQNEVMRLYGSTTGGVVNASRLSSYSLQAVASLLEGAEGDSGLESAIKAANWIVINILDANPDEQQTKILRSFLTERQDLLRSKFVILFSFDAPYYLDSTDISKISAYYCLYDKTSPFIEMAVRILFQEISADGSLPISVAGIGYDLFTALTPDPDQVINLSLEQPSSSTPEITATGSETPAATSTPGFQVGDSVTVRTGILIDRNGNPVPDGTQVNFTLSMSDNTLLLQNVDATTTDGYARASFKINTPGLLEIRASSDPAKVSVTIQMDVTGEGFSVTVLAPTPEVYPTPTPEDYPETTEKITPIDKGKPGLTGWFLMMSVLLAFTFLIFLVTKKNNSFRWRLRWVLTTAGGILISYLYLALQLPGTNSYLEDAKYPGVVGVVILGAVIGLIFGFSWWWIRERK